ncbi:MAG: hypothetical protein ACYC54_04650 [Sedimentisphaerales bacterium]
MELNDSEQDLVNSLKDILLEGYANRENWEDSIKGFIKFLEKKSEDYNKLSYPIKYLYLREACIELSDELCNMGRLYYNMSDNMNDYDEDDYEETEDEEDIEETDSRMVDTDIDIFKELE